MYLSPKEASFFSLESMRKEKAVNDIECCSLKREIHDWMLKVKEHEEKEAALEKRLEKVNLQLIETEVCYTRGRNTTRIIPADVFSLNSVLLSSMQPVITAP